MRKNLHEFYTEACLQTLYSFGKMKLKMLYQKVALRLGGAIHCISPTEYLEDVLRKQIFITLEGTNEEEINFQASVTIQCFDCNFSHNGGTQQKTALENFKNIGFNMR